MKLDEIIESLNSLSDLELYKVDIAISKEKTARREAEEKRTAEEYISERGDELCKKYNLICIPIMYAGQEPDYPYKPFSSEIWEWKEMPVWENYKLSTDFQQDIYDFIRSIPKKYLFKTRDGLGNMVEWLYKCYIPSSGIQILKEYNIHIFKNDELPDCITKYE